MAIAVPSRTHVRNTSYILHLKLHTRLLLGNLLEMLTFFLFVSFSFSLCIYVIYTLYLLQGTSLEAKKNIVSCPPSLFMVPLGYKTCRVERETAARPRTCTEQIPGLVSLFTSRGKLTSLNVKEGNSMSVEILFGMQHV
jgi:hypothetical protein